MKLAHQRKQNKSMNTYQVTVKAVITKTFDIHSDSADAAAREAYELFNPYSGECEEKYEQEVVKIEMK